MQMGNEIANIKDVMTGDTPTTAPVGTTLAVASQAMTQFLSTFKRCYEGLKKEFWLMFECVSRFATDDDVKDYFELTGGDLRADFSGDGTDIQPVADPSLVGRSMKIAQAQALIQFATSPLGEAAGMMVNDKAQAVALLFCDLMGVDNPSRFVGATPPNPMEAAETQAKVQEAQSKVAFNEGMAQKAIADAQLLKVKAQREQGWVVLDNDEMHNRAEEKMNTPLGQTPGRDAPEQANPVDDMLKVAQAHKLLSDADHSHAKAVTTLAPVPVPQTPGNE